MKFSPLKIDFSSPSPDILRSMRPVHVGVKEGYPLKSGYFSANGLFNMKMVADRYRHATYRNKHW